MTPHEQKTLGRLLDVMISLKGREECFHGITEAFFEYARPEVAILIDLVPSWATWNLHANIRAADGIDSESFKKDFVDACTAAF